MAPTADQRMGYTSPSQFEHDRSWTHGRRVRVMASREFCSRSKVYGIPPTRMHEWEWDGHLEVGMIACTQKNFAQCYLPPLGISRREPRRAHYPPFRRHFIGSLLWRHLVTRTFFFLSYASTFLCLFCLFPADAVRCPLSCTIESTRLVMNTHSDLFQEVVSGGGKCLAFVFSLHWQAPNK